MSGGSPGGRLAPLGVTLWRPSPAHTSANLVGFLKEKRWSAIGRGRCAIQEGVGEGLSFQIETLLDTLFGPQGDDPADDGKRANGVAMLCLELFFLSLDYWFAAGASEGRRIAPKIVPKLALERHLC